MKTEGWDVIIELSGIATMVAFMVDMAKQL